MSFDVLVADSMRVSDVATVEQPLMENSILVKHCSFLKLNYLNPKVTVTLAIFESELI